ncbi:hypothetical protein C3747_184g67 [Trypanosoma cruzi]|uniref:Uncharacterized protein n=2 Tax=Trypanosoma cruzi TaxID=5693 RepID=Q4CRW4_TRYCC|nr:hypothetical protein, conserved [Trypanosoma cruzi]EAN83015.1 hypothetical protein, conserved [Trypanosoma cruzi]PWV02915.1 hypothetical protein C3747_184g67 [Trypanosoma cruzi]RNC45720.1 hypothetical protein TcCL_NonESM04520 [Trypanosoma cruzi]|eukprot:XP_804866.1 hypothetical protein [Trypanosoma cruzi strain CL Brener]
MSTASVREELTGETQRHAGSDLLLRKLPLLAKAYALAQQHPKDPQAECNLLCYGPEVYRILSIARRRDDRGFLRPRPCQSLEAEEGDDNDDEKKRESRMDAMVVLPTRIPFLGVIESELCKSMESVQEARRSKKGSEDDTADARSANGASRRIGGKRRRHGAEVDAQKGNDESDEEENEDAGVKEGDGATRSRIEYDVGGEECVLLRAIREPLAAWGAGDKKNQAGATGASNTRNGHKNSGFSEGVGGGRMPWEQMLESIMSRYGAADVEKDGEAVQSYLRRVSWIEQQKKLQLGLGAATGTRHRSEQPWMSMTDAMRVQKEMQRMRLQRKRFHRPHKPTEG